MSNFIKHSFFSQIWNDEFYEQDQVFKRFWNHKQKTTYLPKALMAQHNFFTRKDLKSALRVVGSR